MSGDGPHIVDYGNPSLRPEDGGRLDGRLVSLAMTLGVVAAILAGDWVMWPAANAAPPAHDLFDRAQSRTPEWSQATPRSSSRP